MYSIYTHAHTSEHSSNVCPSRVNAPKRPQTPNGSLSDIAGHCGLQRWAFRLFDLPIYGSVVTQSPSTNADKLLNWPGPKTLVRVRRASAAGNSVRTCAAATVRQICVGRYEPG